MVKAHASRAQGLKFESDSMPRLNARSLFTEQQMGTWWQHWRDKGGENWNHPTSDADGSGQVSSLTGILPYVRKYTGLPLSLCSYVMGVIPVIRVLVVNSGSNTNARKNGS